jgi:hypothetical protein
MWKKQGLSREELLSDCMPSQEMEFFTAAFMRTSNPTKLILF